MNWVRRDRLGHGNFATVNLAVSNSPNSVFPPLMAVKSCGVSHSTSLMNEKLILDELKDCPEVIQCFGDSFSLENGEKLYNVLLEYAPGGALSDRLRNSHDRVRLSEFEVKKYTKALLKGLDYIHKFGYVHCDIKLQNILLGHHDTVRIADFGLAKRVEECKRVGSGCELRGTPMYMSPEMVAGGDQGPAADVWALGCAVSEMVGGVPAWRCDDVAGLLMRIGVGEEVPEIPCDLSLDGRDFLEKCFVKDPSKRWTAEMLLNHPFICYDQDFEERSTSPRCPFDFEDWVPSVSCSITSLPLSEYSPVSSGSWSISASERLRGIVCGQRPEWCVSEDWVTIR